MRMKFLYLIVLGIWMDNISPSWFDLTPQALQTKIDSIIMQIAAPIPSVGTATNYTITHATRNTPVRIYQPAGNQPGLPVVVLIHGGAWVAGSLDTHDNLARYLCAAAEVVIVSVGYSNAPAAKFPYQLTQILDTLTWITAHAHEFAADATKLAVVGDSAGGNMAAALCLMTRNQQGPKIALQILINPALDLTCAGTLTRQNDQWDELRWQALQYVNDVTEVNNPYVSPSTASNLSNLPPTLIVVAEHDQLRASAELYADRLQASGVPTQTYCQLGVGHLAGHGARAALRAKESLDVVVQILKTKFNQKN